MLSEDLCRLCRFKATKQRTRKSLKTLVFSLPPAASSTRKTGGKVARFVWIVESEAKKGTLLRQHGFAKESLLLKVLYNPCHQLEVQLPISKWATCQNKCKKECRRLQAATVKNICEAKDDNYLLPGEDPTEEQMKDWKQKRKENDKKNRSREAEIKSGQLMVTKPIEYRQIGSYLQGAVLWFPQANLLERQVALNFGAHVLTDSLENVSVFVVTDDTPEPRAQWFTVLIGGSLLSRSFFSQKAGFCVMYKAAIQEPEVLYLSEKFQSKHPPLAQLLLHICLGRQRPNGK